MNSKREHIYEIHFIRAIASLMVLLVHVTAAYYYQHGQQYNEYTLFINQISRFGTPMFAMISGFLLFYQVRNRGFQFKRFISSRFTKIGIPFLLWSCFYLMLSQVTGMAKPFESELGPFIINFTFGESFYHLYFMSIVFQFYLIFPIFQMIRSKMGWTILLVLAALAHIYFHNYYAPGQLQDGLVKNILSKRAFLPSWIFFFVFGGYLAYHWEALAGFSRKYKYYLGFFTVILTTLAVVEYKIVGSVPSNRLTNMINIPVITLFIIGISSNLKKIGWLNSFLMKIGTLSMAIYLIHPLTIYLFQGIAPDAIWRTFLFPVIFGIILLGTIGIIKVIQLLPLNQYILTIPKIKTDSTNQKTPITQPAKATNIL